MRCHKDGPNDEQPGYSYVCVFSVLVIICDCVYQLSIFMYSRNLIGCQCDKEFGYFRPICDAILDYHNQYCGGVKYQDFSLHTQEFKVSVLDCSFVLFSYNLMALSSVCYRMNTLSWDQNCLLGF